MALAPRDGRDGGPGASLSRAGTW